MTKKTEICLPGANEKAGVPLQVWRGTISDILEYDKSLMK